MLRMKHTIIPLAAIALLSGASAASAFTGSQWLSNLSVSLTDDQLKALEEARDIRESAETKAQEVLKNAGIDDGKMAEIHKAMHEARKEEHDAMIAAVEANDYDAFRNAVRDSPIGSSIDTKSEFEKFVQAHTLMKFGDREGARKIFDELDIQRPQGRGMGMLGGMRKEGAGKEFRHDTEDR